MKSFLSVCLTLGLLQNVLAMPEETNPQGYKMSLKDTGYFIEGLLYGVD